MKAWVLGVFAVAGCNQIFGNHQATPFDAPKFDSSLGIDAPLMFGTMKLQYMVLDNPADGPIAVPIVQTAKLGVVPPPGDSSDLVDAMPPPGSNGTDGTWAIPANYLGTRYRVIYTPPDGVPVEFQTSLENATFVVPSIGRLNRTPLGTPAPTVVEAFTGGPDGSMGSWLHGRFFSIGLWSASEQNACCLGIDKSVLTYWVSMSGPQGQPTGPNDLMILTDSISDPPGGMGWVANGYGTVKTSAFDASGNPVNPVTSAWTVPTKTTLRASSSAIQSYDLRIENIFNTGTPTTDPYISSFAAGVIATAGIMPFSGTIFQSPNTGDGCSNCAAGPQRPVFMALAETKVNPLAFANPVPQFPTAVMERGSATRTFTGTGVKVSMGIQVIAQQTMGAANVVFGDGVGVANNILFGADDVQGPPKDLIQTLTEPASITRDSGTKNLVLTFTSDSMDTTAVIHDCVVTAYRIETSSVTPLKRYLVIGTPTTTLPLLIESTLFDSTHSYTFGIDCFHGHSNAVNGDFTTVDFPFGSSTIYTKSFTVTPT